MTTDHTPTTLGTYYQILSHITPGLILQHEGSQDITQVLDIYSLCTFPDDQYRRMYFHEIVVFWHAVHVIDSPRIFIQQLDSIRFIMANMYDFVASTKQSGLRRLRNMLLFLQAILLVVDPVSS